MLWSGYPHDVAAVARYIARVCVVVGHSMGGFVAQRERAIPPIGLSRPGDWGRPGNRLG